MARIEKVNEVIKREIGVMIQKGEIKDPRVNFVTIMDVEVSKDLQHARVKFSILSSDPLKIKQATEGLNSSKGYIRKLIAQRVVMRYTPELNFVFDKSLQYAAQIENTLEEIRLEREKEGKGIKEGEADA